MNVGRRAGGAARGVQGGRRRAGGFEPGERHGGGGGSVSFCGDTSPKWRYLAVFASEAGDTGRNLGGLYRPKGDIYQRKLADVSPPGRYLPTKAGRRLATFICLRAVCNMKGNGRGTRALSQS